MIAQGYDLTKNAYNNRFQPYVAYWGLFWTLFFTLVNGYAVFWDFNTADFLTACMYHCLLSSLHGWLWSLPLLDINIPIFVILYFGYKFTMRTKIWKPLEMDFVTVSLDYYDDHEFLIDDLPFFFFRASLPKQKPNNPWSHQRTSGSVLQPSFSEQVLCVDTMIVVLKDNISLYPQRGNALLDGRIFVFVCHHIFSFVEKGVPILRSFLSLQYYMICFNL